MPLLLPCFPSPLPRDPVFFAAVPCNLKLSRGDTLFDVRGCAGIACATLSPCRRRRP